MFTFLFSLPIVSQANNHLSIQNQSNQIAFPFEPSKHPTDPARWTANESNLFPFSQPPPAPAVAASTSAPLATNHSGHDDYDRISSNHSPSTSTVPSPTTPIAVLTTPITSNHTSQLPTEHPFPLPHSDDDEDQDNTLLNDALNPLLDATANASNQSDVNKQYSARDPRLISGRQPRLEPLLLFDEDQEQADPLDIADTFANQVPMSERTVNSTQERLLNKTLVSSCRRYRASIENLLRNSQIFACKSRKNTENILQ